MPSLNLFRALCFPRHPARLRVVAVVAATAGLAACAAGPDYHLAEPQAPADWTRWHGGAPELLDLRLRHGRAGLPGPDWSVFGDPTLLALQKRAMDANPDLQAAALHFAQSRMRRLTVSAQRGPQLDAQAGVTRQRQSEYGAGTRIVDAIAPANRDELIEVLSDPFTLYQAGFDASWELDLWGRVRRSVEAADAQVRATAADLREMQATVLADLARDYFELRGVQNRLRLARADLKAGEELLELVEAQAKGGLTDELDVERQRAQLADRRARLPQLMEQQAQLANRLALLAGERPGALQAELADAGRAPDPSVLPDLEPGVPSELARRRPDIQAAQERLHAATAEIGIAVADLYPRITLGATFGFESFRDDRFGEWGSRQWSVGPSLTLPLFDRGRRRATVTLRELQQQEAAVAYQRTVLQAWHEVDGALTAYTAQRQRNAELARKEQSSQAAYDLAQARYRNGSTDFLVALRAWRVLLQARQEYADGASRQARRLVAVYKALGYAAPPEAGSDR